MKNEYKGGGTVKDVVFGNNAADGIHCSDSCNIKNVWWTNVGEDAATFRGNTTAKVFIEGGGARAAHDKTFQHNGAGSVDIKCFQCIKDAVVAINSPNGDTATIKRLTVVKPSKGYLRCVSRPCGICVLPLHNFEKINSAPWLDSPKCVTAITTVSDVSSSIAETPMPVQDSEMEEVRESLKTLNQQFTCKVELLSKENAELKELLSKLEKERVEQAEIKLNEQNKIFQQQLEQVKHFKIELSQMVRSECEKLTERLPSKEQMISLVNQFRLHQDVLVETKSNLGNKIHDIEMRLEAQIVNRDAHFTPMEVDESLTFPQTISATDVNRLETRVANLVEENRNQKEALKEVNSRFSANFRNISSYLKNSLKEWDELKKFIKIQETEEQKAKLFLPDFCTPESSIILDGKYAVHKCDEFLAFLHHGKTFCQKSLTLNHFDEFYQCHPTFFDDVYKHINTTEDASKFVSELKFNFENRLIVKQILDHFSFVRTISKTSECHELSWSTTRANKMQCCAAPSAYGLFSADAWGLKVSSYTINCSLKFYHQSIEMKVEHETGPDTHIQFGRHFARLP
uniref:Probable pectate lyase F n=1 Tax=Ditylenchus dipsaci TaxID=166011 RepID=A0A915CPL8_9BILA